jgi:hypothetical protein
MCGRVSIIELVHRTLQANEGIESGISRHPISELIFLMVALATVL